MHTPFASPSFSLIRTFDISLHHMYLYQISSGRSWSLPRNWYDHEQVTHVNMFETLNDARCKINFIIIQLYVLDPRIHPPYLIHKGEQKQFSITLYQIHTHTHTHIYIYIYIWIFNNFIIAMTNLNLQLAFSLCWQFPVIKLDGLEVVLMPSTIRRF